MLTYSCAGFWKQVPENHAPAASSGHEFGPFRLEATERLLLRAGQPVSLTPKSFDLLVYLVEHAGRLVTKQAQFSTRRPLFQTGLQPSDAVEQYAAAADGQRFLLVKVVDDRNRSSIGVILGWPALLLPTQSR
jgi:hypothetical protein